MADLDYLLKNKYNGCNFFKIEATGEKAKLEIDYSNKSKTELVSGIIRDSSQEIFKKGEINYLTDFLGKPLCVGFIYSCPELHVKITPFCGNANYISKTETEKEISDLINFNQILEMQTLYPEEDKKVKTLTKTLNSKVSYLDKLNKKNFLDVYENEFSSEFIKNLYNNSIQYAKDNETFMLIKGMNEYRQIEIFYKKKKTQKGNEVKKYIGFQGKASLLELEMLLNKNKRINYEDAEVIEAF